MRQRKWGRGVERVSSREGEGAKVNFNQPPVEKRTKVTKVIAKDE